MADRKYMITSVEDGVGIIQLNHPEKKNALGWELHEGIVDVLREWEDDDAVSCVLFIGNEEYFCAGWRLDILNTADSNDRRRFNDLALALIRGMVPVSERRICRVLGQHRSTQRKAPRGADDEAALTEDIIALARQYGRYGYRRVTALLRNAGWHVNRKRVERIWRREGLKVPQKQPKRGRLWLNDGSCIRLRPEYPGHVWSYDFVEGRTHDGRKFRILSIIDEASRECLALPVARRLRSEDVLAALAELFVTRGPPAHIRSDNGPEFIANAVQEWLAKVGVKTLYITPGSPWENGYCESFNGSMRDELLNGEIFYTLAEARILIEAWRRHYNTVRPHSSLGYRPPAPETATPPWLPSGSATPHLPPAMAPEAVLH